MQITIMVCAFSSMSAQGPSSDTRRGLLSPRDETLSSPKIRHCLGGEVPICPAPSQHAGVRRLGRPSSGQDTCPPFIRRVRARMLWIGLDTTLTHAGHTGRLSGALRRLRANRVSEPVQWEEYTTGSPQVPTSNPWHSGLSAPLIWPHAVLCSSEEPSLDRVGVRRVARAKCGRGENDILCHDGSKAVVDSGHAGIPRRDLAVC